MPFTVVMTVVTNVNTNTRPKNTAANVDPKLVEYSGNGNAFTAVSKDTGGSAPTAMSSAAPVVDASTSDTRMRD